MMDPFISPPALRGPRQDGSKTLQPGMRARVVWVSNGGQGCGVALVA